MQIRYSVSYYSPIWTARIAFCVVLWVSRYLVIFNFGVRSEPITLFYGLMNFRQAYLGDFANKCVASSNSTDTYIVTLKPSRFFLNWGNIVRDERSFASSKAELNRLSLKAGTLSDDTIGAARGNTGKVPAPMEKIVAEKWCYFRLHYFSNYLPKLVKNSIFLLNFYQKLRKLSHYSHHCVVRPNARKMIAWFVKSFERYAKIMHF